MVDVANQGETLGWMLGAIGVLFVVVYFLVTADKSKH